MYNKKVIGVCIALGCIFSVITGIGVYNFMMDKTSHNETVIKQLSDTGNTMENKYIQTASNEEKIIPTAQVVMNQHYKKCGHTTRNKYMIPEEIINMNKKQVEKYYFGWNIDKFSNSEIIISKENNGICDEHYIVKDVDGLVNVYNLDEEEKESLVYSTEIETKYLPQEDREKLKNGIGIVGKDNLSALLEDYE